MTRTLLILGVLALHVGCAGRGAISKGLVDARAAMAQTLASPAAAYAPDAFAEAAEALRVAEREAMRAPRGREALDRAYVARRKAQTARIAGAREADLEALQASRAAVANLQVDIAQQRAAADERARIVTAERHARATPRATLDDALRRAPSGTPIDVAITHRQNERSPTTP